MFKVNVKSYDQLSKEDLYHILRLRSEVFVVEQNCVYQDIDNKDQRALHLFIRSHDDIIAYTRLFNAGDYFVLHDFSRLGSIVCQIDLKIVAHQCAFYVSQASLPVMMNRLFHDSLLGYCSCRVVGIERLIFSAWRQKGAELS